ncbi:YihY/virulence factor BrkB family protein [Savagea sp. SN6]|uniref:YihY/virulence factor BrkB family protein n=1 Tax=Savagea serpentis TaxID=2785297 RepID=A0A8J7KM63_9BACL|nr:YihY/virulence factor BrkB family protein [Savagea serpentis]MBF4502189.1 YihY/virulence factor BrkB family protein [Savagea serpentis]
MGKKNKFVEKKEELMEETKVGQFIDDLKDGSIEEFDATTKEGFVKQLIVRIQKVDVSGLASQLAFFFLLSLFPLLIFMMTLLPFLNLDQTQILLFIREYAPENVASLIETTLKEVLGNRSGGLLSIGALATVWSASKGMNALTKALNRSYYVEETRNFAVARMMSVVFTIMLIVAITGALALPIFGEQIGLVIFSYLGLENGFMQVWNQLRWLVPFLMIFITFTLMYWVVPSKRLPFMTILPGSIIATLGWIVTSLGFSFYISNYGNYSSTYGSIGAIIVLMMWLYFSAIILIICGQLNAVLYDRHEKHKKEQESLIDRTAQ